MFALATKESYFIFDGELYQQVDSVAMVCPLSPTVANIFFAIMKMFGYVVFH